MKFCSRCAAPIQLIIPTGDTRERHVCTSCDSIFYQNPRNVVGTIPIWQDKVLLCKRAIHPRLGFWTLPAGFLEVGETTEAGAIRETLEEAGAMVTIGPLFSLLNVVHVEQVHLFYLASMQSEEFSAGIESLEVQLLVKMKFLGMKLHFPLSNIPWNGFLLTVQRASLAIRYILIFIPSSLTPKLIAPIDQHEIDLVASE